MSIVNSEWRKPVGLLFLAGTYIGKKVNRKNKKESPAITCNTAAFDYSLFTIHYSPLTTKKRFDLTQKVSILFA
jgi:hypothetical protein